MADNIDSNEDEWQPAPPEQTVELMQMQLCEAPKAETTQEYIEAVARYVQLRWNLMRLGSSLIDLNRRFVKLSVRFGITPRTVVYGLMADGRLTSQQYRRKFVIFPKPEYLEFCKIVQEANLEGMENILNDLFRRSCEN